MILRFSVGLDWHKTMLSVVIVCGGAEMVLLLYPERVATWRGLQANEIDGKLNAIAIEVDEEANEMADTIIEKYLREHIVEDTSSTMEMWRLREQARMVAEEVVLVDVINRYR